jgi:phosphoribosylformimino-5-aminoimidazole carboxamide ribotide isomerase
MLLKDYFPNLQKKYNKLSFKGISFNSKEVKEGYIFFAFKGNNTDGNLFIKEAIKNGSKIKKSVGNIEIEIGGGIRNFETIEKYISCGMDYVIIGTKAVQSPEFLSEVCVKYGLKIILGIDSKDGYVAVEGWEKTSNLSTVNFAKEAQKIGVKQIIYTDISTDGMMKGPNLKDTTNLAKSLNIPVIASGGISSANDVMNYLSNEKYGINGVIIGRALYENKISLSKLINELNKK